MNNIDLFETVLFRCGVDHDIPTPARDLTPLCRDPDNDTVGGKTFTDHSRTVMVVDGDFKLLWGKDPYGNAAYELYDRTTQIDDAENLWDHPGYVEERADLLEMLDDVETALAENPSEMFA